MAKAIKKYKTQDEQLAEVIHRLKHLEKRQEAIINHLWREDKQPEKASESKQRELTREEALAYIHGVVLPDIKAAQAEHEGEIGVQGLTDWLVGQLAQPIFEAIKAKALEYLGDALAELKKQAIPYAVKIADWLIDKLENIIVSKYQEAGDEQKTAFKAAIEEHFPNSRLLEKLGDE